MPAHIIGLQTHLPAGVVTNDDLGRENPDWDMTRLSAKTGIRQRHVAAAGETALDLAGEACQKLLARGLVDPACIDYLIVCSQSPDYFLPSGACLLQNRLKLKKSIGAFDFNLGCSGYIYGLQLATALIESGHAGCVLLVTADTYTRFIHPRDRMLRILFGDGASATLVGASAGPGAITAFVVGTDGAGANNLMVPAGGLRLPHSEETARETTDVYGGTRSKNHLFMDGGAIFTFAIRTVPPLLSQILEKAGVSKEQIDWFVLHQANEYMLDELVKRASLPADKVLRRYADVGNTVSSSIPMALEPALEEGRILPGHKLLLAGFGVGYSWGGCLLTWE
ncbi:MAG: ketoacyl-ACP synthase III [bacterium]